jgi:hypothetical protein
MVDEYPAQEIVQAESRISSIFLFYKERNFNLDAWLDLGLFRKAGISPMQSVFWNCTISL